MSVRASTSSTASTCTRATADAPRARSPCAWQAPPATARSTQSGPSVSIRVFRTTVAQFRCQHLVESLRGDAAVEIADLPPPFREADLIGAPGFGDENAVPIAHRSNIRVEERPGVASAQSVPAFDQPHRDLRPLPREPVGDQTVSEAAAR